MFTVARFQRFVDEFDRDQSTEKLVDVYSSNVPVLLPTSQ